MYAKSEEPSSGSGGITSGAVRVIPAREARQLEAVRAIVRRTCLRSSAPLAFDSQLAGPPVLLAQPELLA